MMDPAQAFSSGFDNSFDQSRSLAAASQARAQNQSQFDVIQNLRQQQFDVQKEQSMAQIAAINADQQTKQLQLKEAQRQYDQVPLTQQAGVDFQGVISDAVSKAQTPGEFDSLVQSGAADNPSMIKNFQGGITGYNNAVLQAKQGFMGNALQQLQAKKQLADQQTLFDAQSMGLDPSDFQNSTADGQPGPVDMGSLRAAVTDAQTQRTQLAESFKSNLEGQRQQENIQLRSQGAIDVVNQRLQANTARIKSTQQRVQYQAAVKNAQDAYKAMNASSVGSDQYDAAHDEYVKQLGIADGIYSDNTGKDSGLGDYVGQFMNDTPKPSFSAIPPASSTIPDGATGTSKDGTPVIRRNGLWVAK